MVQGGWMISKERIFYHGTKLENLDSIKKDGLMPNTKVNKNNYPKCSKPDSIYLTTELGTAKVFAGKYKDKCVILEIKESALKGAKLIMDENYKDTVGYSPCSAWSFRVEGITITDFKVKEIISK